MAKMRPIIFTIFNYGKQKWEAFIWLTALVALFFMNPQHKSFSFCVFKWVGFSKCPGCGLGHAIHFALHGQLTISFREHFMGIPAVIILVYRIFIILRSPKLK